MTYEIEPYHYGAVLSIAELDECWVLDGAEDIPEFMTGLEELLGIVLGLIRVQQLQELHIRVTLMGRANELEVEVSAHISRIMNGQTPNPRSVH